MDFPWRHFRDDEWRRQTPAWTKKELQEEMVRNALRAAK